MQRSYSLKKNSQFAYVHRRGRSQADKRLVLIYLKGNKLLVGFSVSKKLGGAVERNHIKRLLRECVRPELSRMKKGSYILIARSGAVGASPAQLNQSFQTLAQKAQVFLPVQ